MTDCIMNSQKIMEALRQPFGPHEIEWRVQSASRSQNGTRILVLPYIDARAIMNRLDAVCGGFWQSNYDKIEVNKKEAFQCRLSIKIGGEWITRSDAAEVSDIESVKGGHSNALKRAGAQWGIGRYLYDLKGQWVELLQRGEHRVYGNFKINGQPTKLEGYFNTPPLPEWALPAGTESSKSKQSPSKQEPTHQPNQAPNLQTKPSNSQQQPNERQAAAVRNVTQLLHYLKIPLQDVPAYLQHTSGSTVSYEEAAVEDLEKLYRALRPVAKYVKGCRKLKLDEDGMLYYAQIPLKIHLESIHSMIFKMDDQTCEKVLDIIREDRKTIAN